MKLMNDTPLNKWKPKWSKQKKMAIVFEFDPILFQCILSHYMATFFYSKKSTIAKANFDGNNATNTNCKQRNYKHFIF